MKSFSEVLNQHRLRMDRISVETLQVNMGRLCNQACRHCHVEAGPSRTESMDERTVHKVIELLSGTQQVHTVDITGGAPELNPQFKKLVVGARKSDKSVIDRCNLTVLFEPGQEGTAHFLKDHEVRIVASLPCYSRENVERQRGKGVFDKSIHALKHLNSLGYGKEGSNLILDLVYNPSGPFLPPSQEELQRNYKAELSELFDIDFNNLFTITNVPIKRFLDDLRKSDRLDDYMELLANNFNPRTSLRIMCRNLISVSWSGGLYDCDFNQALDLPWGSRRTTLWDISSFDELTGQPITFANHCYACMAGAGSSCGGALL